MDDEADPIRRNLAACTLCAAGFAGTATAHVPRPLTWFSSSARILICGQAPGIRVHQSGRPFDDASGVRLRAWLGMDEGLFWDRARVAFVPMAFCFPGYDLRGADLPPPAVCAATWRKAVLDALPNIRLTLLVGQYAQRWHLGNVATRDGLGATVARWRDLGGNLFALPHPSWRNTGWLKRNPWFEAELVPALQARVREVQTDG
jgi:uracil-DNA glycosylase